MCRSGLVLVFVWKQSLRRQTKIRERQWTIFIWICAATCTVQCLFLVWLFRLLGSDFAPLYRTNDFRGPGFRLSEKRWRFFKPREISSHRRFGPGWPNSRVSKVMPFDFRRRMECFAVFGLSSRVSSIRSSSLEIAEKYAKIEL